MKVKQLALHFLWQCWKWFSHASGAIILLLILAATITLIFPDQILPGAARSWSTAKPAQKAEAIFVLGGGSDFRPTESARLWKEGYADKIYVFRPDEDFADGPFEATLETLRNKGVPAPRIEEITAGVRSTKDEATVTAELVAKHGHKRILVPTHLFHTRRTEWIFEKYVADCEVIVTEAPYKYFREFDWWKNEWGVIQFQSEIVKSLYYLVRY